MTEQRLWSLYCVADFSYLEITDITNWQRKDVSRGIRSKWNLAKPSQRFIGTDTAIHMGMGRALGIDVDSPRHGTFADVEAWQVVSSVARCVSSAKQALRVRIMDGRVGWEVLDALDVDRAIALLLQCLREEENLDHAA